VTYDNFNKSNVHSQHLMAAQQRLSSMDLVSYAVNNVHMLHTFYFIYNFRVTSSFPNFISKGGLLAHSQFHTGVQLEE
jgi:hypothetical protein